MRLLLQYPLDQRDHCSTILGYNAQQHIWWEPNTSYLQNILYQLLSTNGPAMIWVCFDATGPELLALIDLCINASIHQNILQSNVRPSV